MNTPKYPDSFIRSALDFDPIAEAQKMTGDREMTDSDYLNALSFQEDKSNMIERLMSDTNDTSYGCTFGRFCSIAESLSFQQVYEEQFNSPSGAQETLRIYWNPRGILLKVESYNWSDGNIGVNSAEIYYNTFVHKSNSKQFWVKSASSGSVVSEEEIGYVWSGSHDVRNGLRFYLTQLLNNSNPMPVWFKSPHLWLIIYIESRDDNKSWIERRVYWDAQQDARINKFPAELRDMLIKAK